jgi:hypothetical protein
MTETETASMRAVPGPQSLLAVTDILPLPTPAVAITELVVEVPDHPEGNVHV